jgi:hypothetical protein
MPDLIRFEEDNLKKIHDAGEATCVIERRLQSGGTLRTEGYFSIDLAIKARLLGKAGPWTEYPTRMVQMRARAFAIRDAYADVLRGIRVAEEEQDVEPEVVHVRAEVKSTPQSATARAKEMLKSRQPATLAEILEDIASAASEVALLGVGERSKTLPDEERTIAREAYKTRLGQLRAPEEEPIPATAWDATPVAAESPGEPVGEARDWVGEISATDNIAELTALGLTMFAHDSLPEEAMQAYEERAKYLKGDS